MLLSLPPRRRLTRELRSRLPFTPPLVTVIVPFFNVRTYLNECVESILSQTLTDLEVILVDDGSTDGSHEIAAAFARADRRVRVVTQVNQGPGAARNTGVAHAGGTYVSFVDSDDRLPRDALRVLVDSARENDADIAAGAIRRFNSTRSWVPAWVKPVHSRSLRAVKLAEFPELLRNNYPVAKVYKRRFWRNQKLSFRVGVIYEDQPLIAQMLSRANKINVVTDIVYDYRAREDRSSISQRPEDMTDLRDRVDAWQLSLDALRGEAPAAVLEGWYQTVYGTHFHWYLNSDSIADPEYWRLLSASARSLLRFEPPGILNTIAPHKRIGVRLLQENQQQLFLDFRDAGGYELDDFTSRVTPEGLEHALPLSPEGLSVMPSDVRVTFREQLELRQEVVRGEWTTSAGSVLLGLSGFAYIDYVDLADIETKIELFATHGTTAEVLVARVDTSDDAVLRPARPPAGFHVAGAGYTASFDLGGPSSVLSLGTWTLSIRVTSAGFTVTEPLRNLSSRAGFVEEASRMIDDTHRVRVVSNANRHVGVSVVVDKPEYVVQSVESTGRVVTARFRPSSRSRPTVVLTSGGTKASRTRARIGVDGTLEASLEIPKNGSGRRRSWDIGALDMIGRVVPLVCSEDLHRGEHRGAGQLSIERSPTGTLTIEDCPRGYIRIERLSSANTNSLDILGEVHPAAGWSGYGFGCENSEIAVVTSPATGSTSLHGSFTIRTDRHAGDPDVNTSVTAQAEDAEGRLSAVPVILGPGVLHALPLLVPGSALIAQRAKGRTLSLRVSTGSHSKGTLV